MNESTFPGDAQPFHRADSKQHASHAFFCRSCRTSGRMRETIARLIGKPIFDAVAWMFRKLRELAYADVEGRYYQYKTNPIDIVEGPGAERWLSLRNVRRSIKELPEFGTLKRLCPDGVRRESGQHPERIEARSLEALLVKAQNFQTRRFLQWLQRVVIYPADKNESVGER